MVADEPKSFKTAYALWRCMHFSGRLFPRALRAVLSLHCGSRPVPSSVRVDCVRRVPAPRRIAVVRRNQDRQFGRHVPRVAFAAHVARPRQVVQHRAQHHAPPRLQTARIPRMFLARARPAPLALRLRAHRWLRRRRLRRLFAVESRELQPARCHPKARPTGASCNRFGQRHRIGNRPGTRRKGPIGSRLPSRPDKPRNRERVKRLPGRWSASSRTGFLNCSWLRSSKTLSLQRSRTINCQRSSREDKKPWIRPTVSTCSNLVACSFPKQTTCAATVRERRTLHRHPSATFHPAAPSATCPRLRVSPGRLR